MPSVDMNRSVFSAGANAATDWGQAGGSAETRVRAEAELKRGFNLTVGAEVFASLDASFSKFLTASVTGRADAEAALSAQIQMPTNLFKELGAAVRLEAVAELAASIEAAVGLSIGDFVSLVESTPGMNGTPARLFRIFLEETSISAGLFAKAALTAQAFAELSITGTAIYDPAAGLRPGFNIVAGMGAGLKAGAGFRVFARCGIQNMSRLVGRSIDVLVDEVIDQGMRIVPAGDPTAPFLEASRPAFKIAFRLAYELGEHLAKNSPPPDDAGARKTAQRCAQVVLEESQRFLLSKIIETGLSRLASQLADLARSGSAWRNAGAERRALAARLSATPASPFDITGQNLAYWAEVGALAAALFERLAVADPAAARLSAMLWSAGALVHTAGQRATRADASLSIAGMAVGSAERSFKGSLPSQPPPFIKNEIRARLAASRGAAAPADLKREDLADYLLDASVLDLLQTAVPGSRAFLQAMTGPLGATPEDVARALLLNAGAIVTDGAGRPDDRATFAAMADALRAFTRDRVTAIVAPALHDGLALSPEARVLSDEVLLPSLRFTVDAVFDSVRRWDAGAPPASVLTEALSAILIRLFGRSLVAGTDALVAAVQEQMQDILNGTADHVDDPNGVASVLTANPRVSEAAEDVADLAALALRIAADVFGPVPTERRARIRDLLYRALDPMPGDAGADFLQQLADDNFMPNAEALSAVAFELGSLSGERFVRFVSELLERLGARMLEELAEAIQAAAAAVVEFASQVAAAVAEAFRRLQELVEEIAALGREVVAAFEEAADHVLGVLASLDTSSGRSRFKDGLTDTFASTARALLESNVVYATLVPGSIKAEVRSTMRSVLRSALSTGIVDVCLEAIGEVASGVDALFDDVRELDPSHPLAPQLADLLLDRMTDAASAVLGEHPGIPLAFDATWQYTVPVYDPPFGGHLETRTARYRIDLGRIPLPLSSTLGVLRSTVRDLAAFENAVEAAAAALARGFSGEQTLDERKSERDRVEREHEALSTRRTEMAPGSRAVAILSPGRGEVLATGGWLRVRLEGVPETILEEGPGVPPRLLVLLNGKRIPADRLSVTSAPGSIPGVPAPGGVGVGLPGVARSPSSGVSGRTGGSLPGDAVGRKGRSFARPAQPLHFGIADSNTRRTGGAGPGAGFRGVAGSGIAERRNAPAGTDGRSLAGQPENADRKNTRRIRGPADGIDLGLGRAVPISRLPELTQAGGPALLLTCELPLSDLEEGINTLAVILLDGRGQRTETTTSFLAAAPAPQERDDRPRLPALGARKLEPQHPAKVEGKGLLCPIASRKKAARTLHEQLSRERPDAFLRLSAASPRIREGREAEWNPEARSPGEAAFRVVRPTATPGPENGGTPQKTRDRKGLNQ